MKLILKCAFALFLCFLLTTCGLMEFYFLPQVPQIDINDASLTGVELKLQNLTSVYADGYNVFYKIYISGYNHTGQTIPPQQYNLISTTLVQDYNAYVNLSDPSTTSALSNINTFTNRGFFELEYDFASGVDHYLIDGITTVISFHPTQYDNPVIIINNDPPVNLLRSSRWLPSSYQPPGVPLFLNTPELNAAENASSNINSDVSIASSLSAEETDRHAYVSMYVIAVGINPETIEFIYSKPTHVGIFKLP